MNAELNLTVISKAQLSKSASAEIIALCSEAFEEDLGPYLAGFSNPIHILGRLDSLLVCHALWITRWLQVGEGPLMRTAYVEGVATDERYRGRGYATAIMERLATDIRDFEIGALSPADTSLYARLGWEYWQGPLFHRKDGNVIRDPVDERVMILRLSKTSDFDLNLPLSVEWREGEIW